MASYRKNIGGDGSRGVGWRVIPPGFKNAIDGEVAAANREVVLETHGIGTHIRSSNHVEDPSKVWENMRKVVGKK